MAKKKRYGATKKSKRKPNTEVRNPGETFKKEAPKKLACKISDSNVNVTDSRANFDHVFVLLERLTQKDILLATTPKESSSSKVSKTISPEECILPSTTTIEECHKISNSTLILPENCTLQLTKVKKPSCKVSQSKSVKPEECILPSTTTEESGPKISTTLPVLSEKCVLPSTTAKQSRSKVSKTKSVLRGKFIGMCKKTRKSSSKIAKTKSVASQECILPSATPVESSPTISNTTPTLPVNSILQITKTEKSSFKISNTDCVSMLPEVCIPPSPSTTPKQSSSRICKTKSAFPNKRIRKSAKAIKSSSKILSAKSLVTEKVILPSTNTRQSSCKVSKTNLSSPQITEDPIKECPPIPKLNDSVEVAEASQVSGENQKESPIIQHERHCPSANDSDSDQLLEARQATSPLLTLSVGIDGNESQQDTTEPSESPCPAVCNSNSSSSACTDIDTDVQVEPLLQNIRRPSEAEEYTMVGLNQEVVVANITPHPNGHDEISFHTAYEPLLPQRSKPKPTYTPHTIVPNPQNNDSETVNLISKPKFTFNPTERSQNVHNIPPHRPPVPVAPANNIGENQRVLNESLPTPTPTSMAFSPLIIREDTYESLPHNIKYQPPSSQKKYKCFACGDAFRLNLDLKEHVIMRHSAICMIYKCTICDRIFCRKEELIDHVDEHCGLSSSPATGGFHSHPSHLQHTTVNSILHPDPNETEIIDMIDLDDSLTNPNGIQNGCDPFLGQLSLSQENNNNSNFFQNIQSGMATYSEEMQMDDSVYVTSDSQSHQDQLFQIEAYGNENSFELPTNNDEGENENEEAMTTPPGSIIAISRPPSPAASLSPPEEVVLEDEDDDQVTGDENENITNNNIVSSTLNFSYIGAPSFNNVGSSFHHKNKKRKKSSTQESTPSLYDAQLFPIIEQKPFSLCQGQDKNPPLEGNTNNITNSPIRVAQKHYNVRERSSNIDYGETQICNKCDKDFLTAEELDDHAKLCRVGVGVLTKGLNRRR